VRLDEKEETAMAIAAGVYELADNLRGQLIQQGDADYEEARRVFNAMIDRRPRFIVRCADVADVMACVNYARQEGLVLSVRGGGHNVAGFATNDDGLVIDLSRMKGIQVNPERQTVRAQGGCTWGDLDHATHPFGLATPGGAISTTGIGGLSLGGGIGHLTRPFGLACDNLISADVVTADGQFRVANEHENVDLFWALRGGGGNFGVVTSFEFRLHPVSTVYAGPIIWSLDKAAEVMKFYREFIANAPEELNGIFAFLVVEPEEPFPEHLHNQNVCGAVLCYVGPMDKAEEVVRPLAEFAEPELVGLGPMPYPVLQTVFDAVSPPGLLNYWKADFVSELSDELISAHVKFGPGVPNPLSGSITFSVDGAAHRVGESDSAWSYRDANFSHVIYAVDSDPAVMATHTEWVRAYWEALHPYSAGGAYVNFMMEEGEDRIAASYRHNYKRLAQIKRMYDPGNLFRMNQNIRPNLV
jgi:FAD/FMN-containing dehydrogenase